MRPRGGDCPTSAATSSKRSTPGRIAAIKQHILRPIVTWLSVPASCSSRSPRGPPAYGMPLAGLRPSWIVARTFTRPRSAMRRIVQSPTEGSANEGNHGRLVVTPATRLGGEVQPAAPAFQAAPAPAPGVRPCVRGKFIFVGDEKLYVRGVTYGTFRPDGNGDEFPAPELVERDFSLMAANGFNAVRTYTPPPRWLLDLAREHGLRVMAGLPSERSAAFIDYPTCARSVA